MERQTKTTTINIVSIHNCITCYDCADGCGFFHNEVQIIVDKRQRRVKGLAFAPFPVVCVGECQKSCVTDFSIVKLLQNIDNHKL